MGVGSSQQVLINNPWTIQGLAYFQNGFVAVGLTSGRLYNSFAGPMGDVQVHMAPVPAPVYYGDMDENGVVNMEDVDDFILALLDPAQYQILYPTRDINRADMNQDEKKDGLDVQGLTSILTQN